MEVMNHPLKLYIASKVSKTPDGLAGPAEQWRARLCAELAQRSSLTLVNLDPASVADLLPGDSHEANPLLAFGRDCYSISQADAVIAYLSDDISIGAAQEMLIAKYFSKPLLGFVPAGSRFIAAESKRMGKTFRNFVHPFVAVPCDALARTPAEAARWLRTIHAHPRRKTLEIIPHAIDYYLKHWASLDPLYRRIQECRPRKA